MDIPSYLTKVGEVIAIADKSRESTKVKEVVEKNSAKPVVKWLDLDKTNLKAKVVAVPERADIDLDVEETLIVELYSK